MAAESLLADPHARADDGAVIDVPRAAGPKALLRACAKTFHARATAVARLSIDTSNDLFEMDPLVSREEIYGFKSRRKEWVAEFDKVLRELLDRRLAGERRKRRRPDAEQSPDALRVLSDSDTSKQNALGEAVKRLAAAAPRELEALDHRVSTLFDEPASLAADNPFAPPYLLDAIGKTSRAIYPAAHVWRPLMERVVSDFVPSFNQICLQLNRFLAENGVLPEIGAVLRARSSLRPADDEQLMPLFSRLINEVHPSLQAWRTLNTNAANAASYRLAPLKVNPYLGAATKLPNQAPKPRVEPGGFPQIERTASTPELSPLLETLDCWQRTDPMAAHLQDNAPEGGAATAGVNRIPWIHAALADQIADPRVRHTIDVVGFLFDYVLQDESIPQNFRALFDKLQVPVLKAALIDPEFFADETHPARRLMNELASASVGAADDEAYGGPLGRCAKAVVDTIGHEFVLDTQLFDGACHNLKAFGESRRKQATIALQPHIDAALAREAQQADRSQVRTLVRDRLSALDIPVDVRAFASTVWADYLTRTRQTFGSASDAYTAAVQVLDDMLWSIAAKERTGQKARLSRMVPSLVRGLRAGAAEVGISGERMKRFLDALYALHIAAIKPPGAAAREDADAEPRAARCAPPPRDDGIANPDDVVADLAPGTWFTFDKDGAKRQAQLLWISPARATYLFATRSAEVFAFTPEELAWDLSAGHIALVLEPVPLFDRAVSATLDYLADQKTKGGAEPARDDSAASRAGHRLDARAASAPASV